MAKLARFDGVDGLTASLALFATGQRPNLDVERLQLRDDRRSGPGGRADDLGGTMRIPESSRRSGSQRVPGRIRSLPRAGSPACSARRPRSTFYGRARRRSRGRPDRRALGAGVSQIRPCVEVDRVAGLQISSRPVTDAETLDGERARVHARAFEFDMLGSDADSERRVCLRPGRLIGKRRARNLSGVVGLRIAVPSRPLEVDELRIGALDAAVANAREDDAVLVNRLVDRRAQVPELRAGISIDLPDIIGKAAPCMASEMIIASSMMWTPSQTNPRPPDFVRVLKRTRRLPRNSTPSSPCECLKPRLPPFNCLRRRGVSSITYSSRRKCSIDVSNRCAE